MNIETFSIYSWLCWAAGPVGLVQAEIFRMCFCVFFVNSQQSRIYSKQGPVGKKCGGPSGRHLGRRTLFLWKKTGDLFKVFLLITVAFIHFTRSLGCRPLFCKKICRSSCGTPIFVGPLFGQTCWTCLNPPLRARWFVSRSVWRDFVYCSYMMRIRLPVQ